MKIKKEKYAEIAEKYSSGVSAKTLAVEYCVTINTIRNILNKVGVRNKCESSKKKGSFSNEEKESIIDLYVNQHRGKSHIAKMYNRSDAAITYWLKKWGVQTVSRSEISVKIREVYGATKGFTGRKHTEKSKIKTSKSGKKAWESGDREAVIGKSRMYDTIVGKVMGKFEVAYIQMVFDLGGPLPVVCRKRYSTPYGTYKPDFIHNGKFVEIKSKFTLCVAKGQYHNNKGIYCDKQWKKICYFKENIGDLDVIVLESNEVAKLFSKSTVLVN